MCEGDCGQCNHGCDEGAGCENGGEKECGGCNNQSRFTESKFPLIEHPYHLRQFGKLLLIGTSPDLPFRLAHLSMQINSSVSSCKPVYQKLADCKFED